LKAWADSLGGITYPLLSDFYPHGRIAKKYGVLRPDGTSERATFIIDKEGKIRYATVHPIDQQPDVEELFKVLESLEPNSPLIQPKTDQDMPLKAPIEVILYCTPWCPSCRRARNFLNQHGIKYIEIDISRDREAAKRVRGWANGNETVPTFDIGGHIIVDYDEQKLIEALGIKR
jgi:glutaredoxin